MLNSHSSVSLKNGNNPATAGYNMSNTAARGYTITVFIYVHPGKENEFFEYESKVLPLLEKHSGRLLQRFRPERECSMAEEQNDLPFEVHVISFALKAGLEYYKNDPERKKYQYLAEQSIIRTEVFESINNK